MLFKQNNAQNASFGLRKIKVAIIWPVVVVTNFAMFVVVFMVIVCVLEGDDYNFIYIA